MHKERLAIFTDIRYSILNKLQALTHDGFEDVGIDTLPRNISRRWK